MVGCRSGRRSSIRIYDSILYSEIAPTLHAITKESNRLRVEVIGQSAGGRNLLLATIAAPGEDGRFGHYRQLRRLMIRDPERAQQIIDQFDDFKVPVFINGSIHGPEYPGTDAVMRLIETLAYDNSPEVQAVLDNIILLINVNANPDGRVAGTRYNANNVDINRDFLTQSQPESRATVGVLTKWNPMVVVDLHGFINPMLIEPNTPTHNPNYEYDLYLKWSFEQALAMEAELIAQTNEEKAWIPYRDWPSGWDD
jgi:murein tripeptide amidase MpaA